MFRLMLLVLMLAALPLVAMAQDLVAVPADPGAMIPIAFATLAGALAYAAFELLKRVPAVAALGAWPKRLVVAALGGLFGGLLTLIPGGPFGTWVGIVAGLGAAGGFSLFRAAGTAGRSGGSTITTEVTGFDPDSRVRLRTPPPGSSLVVLAGLLGALSMTSCAAWYQALTPTERAAVDATETCLASLSATALPCVSTCLRTSERDCEAVCVAKVAGVAGADCAEAYGSMHSAALASAARRAVGAAMDLYLALRATGPAPGGPAGGAGL